MENSKATHTQSPSRLYRYNRALVLLAAAVGLVCTWLVLFLAYFVIPRGDFVGTATVLLVSPCPVLFFLAVLSRATLAVDETGLSAKALGMPKKTIHWSDVKRIRKIRVSNGYGHVDEFHIQDAQKHSVICRFLVNVRGSIVFTQDIRGLRDLLDEINFYVREYKIPLVVLDLEAVGARLPALSGRAYWRQATDRTGITVAEF
jgi:hypothetical protein